MQNTLLHANRFIIEFCVKVFGELIMAKMVDHWLNRVECKRMVTDFKKYKISYDFKFPKWKIEDKTLKAEYVFKVTFAEGVGEIVVEGGFEYKDTPKVLKELEKQSDTSKELQQDFYNLIFRNAIMIVMDLSRHLGLPSPVKLPYITHNSTQ